MGRTIQYLLFDTAIGWAALAWGEQGLVGVHLPERDPAATRRGLQRRFPDAVEAGAPAEFVVATEGIRALMRGDKADFSTVRLDIARVPPFNAEVYEITRAIPPGKTLTYGEIAAKLGDKLLARDVGVALGQNPWPVIVPCHRVTAADGKLGGFSARGGALTKLKLLTIEGARAAAQPDLFGEPRPRARAG